MFVKKIGIDLGTVNTLVYVPKKGIVINEPSLVIFGQSKKDPLAIGQEAQEMIGRTPQEIQAHFPLKDGVIADYKVTEIMLNYFINKAIGNFQIFKPETIISVPAGISSSERRAVIEATLRIGAKNVYLIKEPVLAAIGAGLPIRKPAGHMIIDVGGGTTEIAVISLSSIVHSVSIKIGGLKMNQAIVNYIRKKYNLEIGPQTAEKLKLHLASSSETNEHSILKIKGQDLIEGLPSTLEIPKKEIIYCLKDLLNEIAQTAKRVLQETPPELSSDIFEEGITLTGGGSLITGLPNSIYQITGIRSRIAEKPLFCVIQGIGYALNNLAFYKKSLLSKKPS